MDNKRRCIFSWDLIGDIELGRPNLGRTTSIEAYRLMQFTFRDVAERHFGYEKTEQMFYEAGQLAGKEFYRHVVAPCSTWTEFTGKICDAFRSMGIGIVRFESTDTENNVYTLSVAEDLDCSGLPELDYEVCTYDEGFCSGLLEEFSGKPFKVKETECWCTGSRTCRFRATPAV